MACRRTRFFRACCDVTFTVVYVIGTEHLSFGGIERQFKYTVTLRMYIIIYMYILYNLIMSLFHVFN